MSKFRVEKHNHAYYDYHKKKTPYIVTKLGNFLFFVKKTVRVIAKSTLREFWMIHKDCEEQLKSWFDETEKSNWISPHEIKIEYPTASILPGNRIVFNIKGNSYRLIVKVNYNYGIIWIRFVGTHGDYDKINAETI